MGRCVIAACVHFSSAVRADESGLVTHARLVRSSTTSTINDRDILGWGPAMAGDLAAATYDGIIGRVMRAMQDKVLRVLVVSPRVACGWQWPHSLVVILVVQGLRVD